MSEVSESRKYTHLVLCAHPLIATVTASHRAGMEINLLIDFVWYKVSPYQEEVPALTLHSILPVDHSRRLTSARRKSKSGILILFTSFQHSHSAAAGAPPAKCTPSMRRHAQGGQLSSAWRSVGSSSLYTFSWPAQPLLESVYKGGRPLSCWLKQILKLVPGKMRYTLLSILLSSGAVAAKAGGYSLGKRQLACESDYYLCTAPGKSGPRRIPAGTTGP